MDGFRDNIFLDDESRIKKDLDGIDLVIKSWNVDHILAISPIIDDIKRLSDEALTWLSAPVIARIESVFMRVQDLIPEWKQEIEGKFLSIWDTELLVTKGWIVVFENESTQIVSCWEAALRSIEILIENDNSLSVAAGKMQALMYVVKALNEVLNPFRVYFWVVDDIFFASGTEIISDLPSRQKEEKISWMKEEIHVYMIHTNTLFFWNSWEKKVNIKIFSPLKYGKQVDIKVIIWKEERIFKPFSLKLLLELMSQTSEASIVSTQAANIAVFNLLKNTQIDIIWNNMNLRLALRDDSLEKIRYLHSVREPIPNYSQIEEKTICQKKAKSLGSKKWQDTNIVIPDEDKLLWTLLWIELRIHKAMFVWRHKKFVLQHWEDRYEVSEKQKDLLCEFMKAKIASIKLWTGAKYQIYMQLKKILPENIIDFFESKRMRWRATKNSSSYNISQDIRKDFDLEKVPEAEKIHEVFSWILVQTKRVSWVWRLLKFYISLWDVLLTLTPKENSFFCRFMKKKEASIVERKDYVAYRKICAQIEELWQSNFLKIFTEKRVDGRTQKKSSWANACSSWWKLPQKNWNELKVELSENEQLEIFVRWVKIKLHSKKIKRNRDFFELQVWENILELNSWEFTILQILSQEMGRVYSISWKNLPYLRSLRSKLPENFINNQRGVWYYLWEHIDSFNSSLFLSQDDTDNQSPLSSSPLPSTDFDTLVSDDFKEYSQSILVNTPGTFFSLEQIIRSYSHKIDKEEARITLLMMIASMNSSWIVIIQHPDKWYTFLPENMYEKYYTGNCVVESQIWQSSNIYFSASLDCVFFEWKILFEPRIFLEYCFLKRNTLSVRTDQRTTDILREKANSSGANAYISIWKNWIHDKKWNALKFKKYELQDNQKNLIEEAPQEHTLTTPDIKSSAWHKVHNFQNGLSFYIDTFLFSIEDVEWLDYYVLKCNWEIISDKFLLSPQEKNAFEDTIRWETGWLNTHIKNKLERYTPLSMKREKGKVIIYIKVPITPPEKNFIVLENGYRFLVWWIRCELTRDTDNSKTKWFARLTAIWWTWLSVSIPESLFWELEELLKKYTSGKYITLSQWLSTMKKIGEKFGEIWVRKFYEIEKVWNTSKFRLRA